MHGANRTGRPFTGDHAASCCTGRCTSSDSRTTRARTIQATALKLSDAASQRGEMPAAAEPASARGSAPLQSLPRRGARLGAAAGDPRARGDRPPRGAAGLAPRTGRAALRARRRARASPALHSERGFFDSYHCSRYNMQTRRLTTPMFEAVLPRYSHFLRAPMNRTSTALRPEEPGARHDGSLRRPRVPRHASLDPRYTA